MLKYVSMKKGAFEAFGQPKAVMLIDHCHLCRLNEKQKHKILMSTVFLNKKEFLKVKSLKV